MKTNYTHTFGQLSKNDASIAGGKGASLGEMTQAGIPVPPGFVILSSTFDQFIEKTNLVEEIDAALDGVDHKISHTVDAASLKIEELVKGKEIPEDIKNEILENFKNLGAKFVAVRSSATAEDGADNAWAGQLESYLNTTEEMLFENIKKCWASLFTPRAIFYRFEKGLDKTKISVAVVVQKMVQSEKSGIAFSVHPITEDPNQLIIEAGFGLGEAIVSGSITPDSYIVEKNPRTIIDMKINHQSRALYRKEEGGNEWKELEPTFGSSQVLSSEEVLRFADIVVEIEKHYGFPCDIEWAFEGGNFYITQSRPITTLSKDGPISEKKKEFRFMWGQKQSAMFTEAMMYQILVAIDEEGKTVDSHVPETLFILSDGVFSHFMPDESITIWNENSRRYAHPNYGRNLFDGIDAHLKNYFSFCSDVRKMDLEALSNKELGEVFMKYQNFIIKTFHYYATSTPSGTAFVVDSIRKILEDKLKEKTLVDDYFITLSTPAELDETMKERLDFLKLSDQKEVTDEQLEAYAHTYPALFFNTYDAHTVLEFLRARLKQQCESGFTALEETKKMNEALEKITHDQEKIYAEFQNDDLKRYASILQQSGLRRYKLKHTWSGGEYLCLNLIHELQKRIAIDFDDFIKTYSLSDVNAFLDTGTFLSSEEIQKRKKCRVIHYHDGERHFYSGDEAVAYKDARIPIHDEVSSSAQTIRGEIANKGLARGRARVVFVQDLQQFIKDSDSFKHDEILVTTMTSPIMIPIIEKAGAIVTDEGGICSHAAISAREFKIPCVIGTENACSVIKTGDFLEVDANNGIVKILEKA